MPGLVQPAAEGDPKMANTEMELMAHLMRRAGFGATRDELELYVAQGYEATVDDLLHPERAAPLEEDVIRRYHVDQNSLLLIRFHLFQCFLKHADYRFCRQLYI